MSSVVFKKEINATVDQAIARVTEALKTEGFGVLTRIDFHEKIKEKLGKQIPKTVILGACNPSLAYEVFSKNTDVAGLLPCNAVVREIGPETVSVELAKPTAMMQILGDSEIANAAADADVKLERVLQKV